jgi:hypothetical protein
MAPSSPAVEQNEHMQYRVTIDYRGPDPVAFSVKLGTPAAVGELVLASLDTASVVTVEPMLSRPPVHERSKAAADHPSGRRAHGLLAGAVDDHPVDSCGESTEGAEQATFEVAMDVAAEDAVRAGIGDVSFVVMARAAYRQAMTRGAAGSS